MTLNITKSLSSILKIWAANSGSVTLRYEFKCLPKWSISNVILANFSDNVAISLSIELYLDCPEV